MSTLRLAFQLIGLAFLWTACRNANTQKAGIPSTSAIQRVLSLDFKNNGQHLAATVGQQIEISLGLVGPRQYGDPQVSSPALGLEGVATELPPNPGGATHIYIFKATAEGEAKVTIPIINFNLPPAEALTFKVTINVRSAAGNELELHPSTMLDQANTAPWKDAWMNVHNVLRQEFRPSLPTLTGVEVELVVANPGTASAEINMMLLDRDDKGLAAVRKTVPTAECRHVLFLLPKGGLRLTPGKVYSITLSSVGSVFGWKYVVGGYANGAASFHGFPGRPLLPHAHSSFLFRTFGAS
jgi:hypothetical protein